MGKHGLILDWGGVLTPPTRPHVDAWLQGRGVDTPAFWALMAEWGDVADDDGEPNPMQQLERGRLTPAEFEVHLAAALTERSGREHGGPLIEGMWETLEHDAEMQALVRRARAAGIRTVLLSNSWGNPYRREDWPEMFDLTVVSGEVGMRKPDTEIFEMTLARAGLAAGECVFVDDLLANVRAAESLGITSIHHRDHTTTAPQLRAHFPDHPAAFD